MPSSSRLPGRVRWTASDAQRHLTAIRASGEPFGSYCRRHGFSFARLAYWRTRLEEPALDRSRSGFVAIVPRAVDAASSVGDASSSGVSVRCAGGAQVLVAAGFDAAVLRAVVAALSS